MDTSDRGRVLDRLAKLLALVESDNPHEAGAARRQADSFMLRYGLTESDARSESRPGYHELPLGSKGWRSPWRFALVTLAARRCGAEALATWSGDRRKVRLVGERADVETAHALYRELLEVVGGLERIASERYAGDLAELAGEVSPSSAADSFRMGLVVGLAVLLGRPSTGARSEAAGQGSPAGDSPGEVRALVRCRPDYGRKARYSPAVRSTRPEDEASPALLEVGRAFVLAHTSIEGGSVRVRGPGPGESS